MKYISRSVFILSLVSLFTDTASEMLYPIMPLYLKSIGFSVVLIGVLEGLAEALAGLSKGYFGKLSDQSKKRLPFVQIGYTLSAITKPMMAVSVLPLWIFFTRSIDRLGKGVRSAARDAMLSDSSDVNNKAKVFGFHRSMDTLGAVIGPLIALSFLYYYPNKYIYLFYIAFIPGILAVISTLILKEKSNTVDTKKYDYNFFSFLSYWKNSHANYKKLIIALLLFTLVNSSDVFLLLKAKEAGISDTYLIGVYIFYNLIYALFAFPLGIIADKIGMKKILVFGLIMFSLSYYFISISTLTIHFIGVFLLYGIYAAATEGISKAWISNIVTKNETATAIGLYTSFQSIATMLASTLTGIIWYKFGSSIAFTITSISTLLIASFVFSIKEKN
ncbi:MAG: MFS transporter [bacterium]